MGPVSTWMGDNPRNTAGGKGNNVCGAIYPPRGEDYVRDIGVSEMTLWQKAIFINGRARNRLIFNRLTGENFLTITDRLKKFN